MPIVYKYQLEPVDTRCKPITFPPNAKILKFGVQGENIFVWAEIESADTANVHGDTYIFELFCTGQEMSPHACMPACISYSDLSPCDACEDAPRARRYADTVFMGHLVFHIYRRITK